MTKERGPCDYGEKGHVTMEKGHEAKERGSRDYGKGSCD